MGARSVFWASVAAVVLVAGCADVPVVGRRQHSDQSRVLAQGALGAGLPVEILGTPYDVPPEVLEERVLTEMSKAITWSASGRFTPIGPSQEARNRMRVVVAFNGGPGGSPQCRGKSGGGPPAAGGAVRINAVFCDAEFLIADVSGRIGATDGIDDPGFASLIRQVTLEMFFVEPERDGDRVLDR